VTIISRRTAAPLIPIFLALACSRPPPAGHHPAPAAPSHWGYEGHAGPEHWDDLEPAYAICEDGVRQSPIDLSVAVPGASAGYELAYAEHTPTLRNNGHTVQVDHPAGSTLTIGGNRFELLQYHFHTPSEHSLGGVRQPMELHLVHRGEGGALAVVGVLLAEGAHNAAYAPLLDNLPATAGEQRTLTTPMQADALLPDGGGALTGYRYAGSLTTPPCSEGVDWHVLPQPVELSAAQIAQFRRVFRQNSRPVEPLDGRMVVLELAQ
jgi:carbonic anhydrase